MKARLNSSNFIRYIAVGGISYFVELGIILLMVQAFGFHRTVATGISFWIALIISFILMKIVAFKNYEKQLNTIFKQSALYLFIVLLNYAFTLSLVSFFSEDKLIISRSLAMLIVTTWNYLFYKLVIFKEKQN